MIDPRDMERTFDILADAARKTGLALRELSNALVIPEEEIRRAIREILDREKWKADGVREVRGRV